MSEISKNIVSLIVSKEFHKAKTLIHEAMNNKLGILLEEKLLEYAPTLYEGEDTEYSSALGGERYNKQGENSKSVSERMKKEIEDMTKELYPSAKPEENNDPPEEADDPSDEADDPSDESSVDRIRSKADKVAIGVLNAETTANILTSPLAIPGVVSRFATKLPGLPAAAVAVGADTVAKVTGGARSLALKGTNKVFGPVAKYAPWYITANAAYDVADRAVNDQRWYVTNAEGKDERAEALTDLASNTAHAGVRTASLINPWTAIPSFIDQHYNDGRVNDWVTDTIIKHGNMAADKIETALGTNAVPTAADIQRDADRMTADLQAERVNKRNLRKQDFEQALDRIGKPGKPPVAAGTVREGSGRVMYE
jgi:hypothetical protein